MDASPNGSPAPDTAGQGRGHVAWLALGITLVGAILRFYHLGHQNLWLDETSSFHIATAPSWLEAALQNNSPPLYYLLLRGMIALGGVGEASVRLPSAILGTLTIPAVMWLAGRLFGCRIALWAGSVLAVSPIHIYYSQEARAYVLLVLCLTLAYAALWGAVERDRRRDWLLFAATAAAALYSHYLAALALLTSFALPALVGDARRRHRWALSLGLAVGTLVPWMTASLTAKGFTSRGVAWIAWAWERTPPLLAVPKSLELFSLGAHAGLLPVRMKQLTVVELPAAVRLGGLAVFALLGLRAAWPQPRAGDGSAATGARLGAMWLLLLAPLAALWLASFVKPIYLVGRYDMVAFPAFPVLVGVGLGTLGAHPRRRPWLPALAATVALIPVGGELSQYYGLPPMRLDYRATAAVLDRSVPNGQLVVFTGQRGFPILYELARLGYVWEEGWCRNPAAGRAFRCAMFPLTTVRGLIAHEPDGLPMGPEQAGEEVERLLTGGLPPGAIFVALGSYSYSAGRLSAAPEDVPLLDELEDRGFTVEAAAESLGLLRSSRPGGDLGRAADAGR